MAKVGFNKSKATMDTSIVLNKESGIVYSISNPAEKLIASVAYMGEPGFYPDAAIASNNEFNDKVLDERGTDILNTAIKIAKGDNPENLLCIAKWARQEMHMRLFPQLLVAVASKYIRGDDKTMNPVSRYVPAVCSRPDDLLQLLEIYNCLFGTWEEGYPRANIPGCLQKGMAFALMTYSSYSLIKYNKPTQHPNFKDLLLSIRGGILPKRFRHKEGFPISKAMFEFLVNNKVVDTAPRILQARKEFYSISNTASIENLASIAKEAGLTWENFVSAMGNRPEAEKEKQQVWSAAFNFMPYMATLRNLRNAIEHQVSGLDSIIAKISDEKKVLNSKQLPFRYYAAYKAIRDLDSELSTDEILNKIEKCLKISIQNLADIPGNTAVFIDNSGSMCAPVSRKSTMSCGEIGNLLGAIFHAKSKESFAFPFGSIVAPIILVRGGSLIQNAEELSKHERIHGHGTDAGSCISYLITNDIKVDRIIILSDLQTYGERFSRKTFEDNLISYRKKINPDVWLHSVDLTASQVSMAKANHPRVNLLGGFSEKIITMILKAESTQVIPTRAGKQINTLSDIVSKHQVLAVDAFLINQI